MKTPNINAILRASPRHSNYGAPMGAANYANDLIDGEPIYLQCVRFVDGDYAPDGTYWGGGMPLWCAFTVSGNVRWYVRAYNRTAALNELRIHAYRVAIRVRGIKAYFKLRSDLRKAQSQLCADRIKFHDDQIAGIRK